VAEEVAEEAVADTGIAEATVVVTDTVTEEVTVVVALTEMTAAPMDLTTGAVEAVEEATEVEAPVVGSEIVAAIAEDLIEATVGVASEIEVAARNARSAATTSEREELTGLFAVLAAAG